MIIDDYEVGYNIPAKIGMEVNDIQTPSLIIDYKIGENALIIEF